MVGSRGPRPRLRQRPARAHRQPHRATPPLAGCTPRRRPCSPPRLHGCAVASSPETATAKLRRSAVPDWPQTVIDVGRVRMSVQRRNGVRLAARPKLSSWPGVRLDEEGTIAVDYRAPCLLSRCRCERRWPLEFMRATAQSVLPLRPATPRSFSDTRANRLSASRASREVDEEAPQTRGFPSPQPNAYTRSTEHPLPLGDLEHEHPVVVAGGIRSWRRELLAVDVWER
jgi:hypothetical protein